MTARAVVLSHTETIEPEIFALDNQTGSGHSLPYLDFPFHESMEAHCRYIIGHALEEADGDQTKAADRLGLQRTYFVRLIKRQKEKTQKSYQE